MTVLQLALLRAARLGHQFLIKVRYFALLLVLKLVLLEGKLVISELLAHYHLVLLLNRIHASLQTQFVPVFHLHLLQGVLAVRLVLLKVLGLEVVELVVLRLRGTVILLVVEDVAVR